MSAILIISVFLIFVASLAILRTKRSSSNEETDYLPPGISSQGLFADSAADSLIDDGGETERNASEKLEKELRERAARGDLEVLNDAHATGRAALYRLVLDTLVERCAESATDLRALAAFITRSDALRAGSALAERLLQVWEQDPTRSSVAELLRVAALSDDAGAFELAMSTILRTWEDGRLSDLSAGELRSLFEGEYWLLSSEAKRSGAGFRLKQKLADARRRLSKRARPATPPTTGDFPTEVSAQKERP